MIAQNNKNAFAQAHIIEFRQCGSTHHLAGSTNWTSLCHKHNVSQNKIMIQYQTLRSDVTGKEILISITEKALNYTRHSIFLWIHDDPQHEKKKITQMIHKNPLKFGVKKSEYSITQ